MSWKDIKDKVTSALVEEDGPSEAHTQQPATTPSPAPVVPITSSPVVTASMPMTTETPDSDMYQRLVFISDWESSPAFQAIKKHLAPLEGMAIDAKTKFSVALKQAAALDGIDPAAINQTFEKMKGEVQSALANFQQSVANKTALEVDQKQTQAKQLQEQARQLQEEAFAAQQKLQAQQHKFEVAATQRLTEINSKQAEYASLSA